MDKGLELPLGRGKAVFRSGWRIRRARTDSGVWAVAVALAALVGGRLGGAEPVRVLQQFMQSPPPIEKLVYEVTWLAQPGWPTTYHLARWHSNGCFFRTTTNLATIEAPLQRPNSDELCGRKGDLWWYLAPLGQEEATFWVWNEDRRFPLALNAVTAAMDSTVSRGLARVLNMGLTRLPIGAVEWNGDRFRYLDRVASRPWEGRMDNRKGDVVVEGQLFYRRTDGLPERLDVVTHQPYERRWPLVRHRIEFDYGYGEVPAGLPSQITVWLLPPTAERPKALEQLRIHVLKPAAELLPEALLDPERLFGDLRIGRGAISNITRYTSTRYRQGADGRWRPEPRRDDRRFIHPERGNLWRRAYVISAGLLLLSPAVALLLWKRRRRTMQERNQNNPS